MKRVAKVDRKVCVAKAQGFKYSTKGAISVWKGCFARVAEETCVGCGKCAGTCPAGCIAVAERVEAQ